MSIYRPLYSSTYPKGNFFVRRSVVKLKIKLLGLALLGLVFSQGITFNTAKLSADDNWKNIYGISWTGTAEEAIKYSKQMGYDYIALKSGQINKTKYANNTDKAGLKFYIMNPKELQDMNPVVGAQLIDIANAGAYTTTVKDYYNKYFAWKSMDAFPYNLAPSWYHNNATQFRPGWDIQQQVVIDYLVTQITAMIRGYEDKTVGFTFAGCMYDMPTLSGSFVKWNADSSSNNFVNLSYWTGSNSSLVHDSITHEYSTYTEANVAFYKQLNTTLKKEWPDAKWVIEPYFLYASYWDVNDWVYQIKNRPDKDALTPDLILQEGAGTQFVDDSNIFNSGVNITRGMVGISSTIKREEYLHRLYAAKAGINGAWYTWFGLWGFKGATPHFLSITEVYPRVKLIRCIPNWDNLNGIATASRSWNNSTTDPIYNSYDSYNNQQSYIDGNVMYSRHPKTEKLFAVFLTTNGIINLKTNETVVSMQHADGYFIESGDASADFDITGTKIRLKSSVSIAVDSTNGQVKGNGYILTLSSGGFPKVTTGSATNVTSNSAALDGTVNASGLSTTSWAEYGVSSGSYTSKSTIQSVSGSNDTAVSFSISGLSEAKTYYYRLVAQNSVGTTYGSEMSFDSLDATVPNGSIIINKGATYTKSPYSTLTLSATDNVGVMGYYLSTNTTTPSASDAGWMPVASTASYSANVKYTLSSGDGSKAVYVWFKDAAGNISNTASDSITLDTTAPSNSAVSINKGATYTNSTYATLTLSASDTIGVSGYYLSTETTMPSVPSTGWTPVTSTASYSANANYTLSSGDGSKTIYVWYKDSAGNVSNMASGSITLDTTAPVITITSPTPNSTYTATGSTISLGGSASDNTSGVLRVTWSNSLGGSGIASGTTSWSISGISIFLGQINVITVTAQDRAGNKSTDTITVSW
ncbi:MAG: hypothetical protein HW384_660 [Dehalococcoidia bacterium]|nr:hypothetical protein [Dehalococcoidia bacterium]